MKPAHRHSIQRSSRGSAKPGRTYVLHTQSSQRNPSFGNRAAGRIFFTETPQMTNSFVKFKSIQRDDISPHLSRPGNALQDSVQITPHSSYNKFRPTLGISSQSTLDNQPFTRDGSFKTLLRGRVSITPSNFGAGRSKGVGDQSRDDASPLSLLRDSSFYRQLMSSRTSKRGSSNYGNNQEDLKFKKMIDTYRSSKHSLFTLIQNQISRQSLDQIGYLEDIDYRGVEAEDDETERSLLKLNGEYKKMQNQLNRLINGDHPKGGLNHISLHDGVSGRFIVQRNASHFFKAECKNPQLSVLRVIAKIDYGQAKIYGSAEFEYPNYANNAMRNANLQVRLSKLAQGQAFYFQPEKVKGMKFVYLSIEAAKKTALQMNVKFVRGSERATGKFDPNVSLFSNPNAGTEPDPAKRSTKDAANASLFKSFMQGKAVDQQVRLEVLAKAKQVRLEKMRMMVSLKQKLEEDLHFAKESNRAQKMRNYFEKERLKSVMVRRKKEHLMTSERKHKVALMKKIEITRYLREEENKRIMKLKRAQYFIRKWAAAITTCNAFEFVKSRFNKLRDIELRKIRENEAASTIQRCYQRYLQRTLHSNIKQRAIINAREAIKSRAQITQDLAKHTATSYMAKFLKDCLRIQQVSGAMVGFVQGGRV